MNAVLAGFQPVEGFLNHPQFFIIEPVETQRDKLLVRGLRLVFFTHAADAGYGFRLHTHTGKQVRSGGYELFAIIGSRIPFQHVLSPFIRTLARLRRAVCQIAQSSAATSPNISCGAN